MRKLIHAEEEDTFEAREADAHKIYAAADGGGRVCIVVPHRFEGREFRIVLLDNITIFNSYSLHTKECVTRTLPETLEAMRTHPSVFPDAVYEFDSLLEFLEWAVEQERARVEGRDG